MVESGLRLIGLIGLIDPPRPEAAVAVRDCISAGITPVMITGDHPATARAIAQRLGILSGAESDVLTGADLAALNDAALRERVRTVRVYARVDPLQDLGFDRLDDQDIHVTCASALRWRGRCCVPQ